MSNPYQENEQIIAFVPVFAIERILSFMTDFPFILWSVRYFILDFLDDFLDLALTPVRILLRGLRRISWRKR